MTDPRRSPHPANTLNELPGEEWLYFTKSLLDDGLPVGARARRAQGARGEQAAAPDGPADRVLQPDRRPRARPVRRGRRHVARGGHRPRPAAGDRHRARAALGGDLRGRRARPVRRARRPRSGARRPRRRGSRRPAGVRPVGAAARRRRRAGGPADHGRRLGRSRGDRSAVQPAAPDDDGRRAARRARTRTAGPTTRWSPIRPDDLANAPDYADLPRTDGRSSSPSSGACCATGAMPS